LIVTVADPDANVAPIASAGADFSVDINTSTALAGSVSDDDKPSPPAAVSSSWSQFSGPGTATFTNVADPVSTVIFDTAGQYVLRLTADDSELTHSDDVTVTVVDPNVNTAPTVDAGSDFSVVVNTLTALAGSVSDDGLPDPPGAVTINWSQFSGPGTAGFSDVASPTTGVSFDTTGVYVLRLSADDSEFSPTDDVTVTVIDPSSEQTFIVMQDTYTRSNTASSNYGTDAIVRIQNWGDMTGFLRFDFASFTSDSAATATLRAHVDDVKKSGPVSVHKVLGDWDEATLTENNKPALGPALSAFGVSTGDDGEVIQIDVTDIVNQLLADPANDYGIALAPDNVNFWLDSRESGNAIEIVATPAGPPSNTAPQVDVGSDQVVIMPAHANLSATVVDDGLPAPPAATSLTWDTVSGPGAVTFGTPAAAVTTASFAVPGEYVLRLTADDSVLTGDDSLTVTVIDPTVNQTPTATAGPDFGASVNTTVALAGAVSDDGLPSPPATVAALWSQFSGPGTATFAAADDPETDVSFDAVGVYVLRLTADDSELTHDDDITVTVIDPGSQQTFAVTADTYTRENDATSNYGTDTRVRVQVWGTMTGFARFDLAAFAPGSTVTSAVLNLAVEDVKRDGPISVHKVLGDWAENSLTDANSPALGPSAASLSVSTADNGQVVQIDITALFNELLADPGNDFGIALVPGVVNLWIESREGGTPMFIETN
jgi:hypothetical protein